MALFHQANLYVLSTVLLLGIGEEDKETELLPIGRAQVILWFPSLLKIWTKQHNMCKVR